MTGIKYISFCGAGGYGVAAKTYLWHLIKAGMPVTWAPIIPGGGSGPAHDARACGDIEDPGLKSVCHIDIPYDLVIVHTVPEYYTFWKSREAGKKIIGMTVWETDILPRHWRDLINILDGVIVPTEWNKKIFQQCGVAVPIYVLPHISEFHGETDPALTQPAGKYTFYSIGDWTNRKVPFFSVEAFLRAFTKHDDVRLVLKTSHFDYTVRRKFILPRMKKYRRVKDRLNRLLQKFTDSPEIKLIDTKVSRREIQSLHQNSDCFVSLCRSEGWGIPAYEAAWYGKPVVITGFGGQTAFLDPDGSYLVDFKLIPVNDPEGGRSYTPDQKWAAPDVGHGARILRRIYSDPSMAVNRGRLIKEHLVRNFNAEIIINRLIQIIEENRA